MVGLLGLFVILRQLVGAFFVYLWTAVATWRLPRWLTGLEGVAIPLGIIGLYLLFIEGVQFAFFGRRRDFRGFFERYKAKLRSATPFTYFAPDASVVNVAGEFNEWNEWRMTKDCHGNWRYEAQIVPGSYQYKFVVDGAWREDPKCPVPSRIPNAFGSHNSVVDVGCSRLSAAHVSMRTQIIQILILVAGAVLGFAATVRSGSDLSVGGLISLAISMILGILQSMVFAGGLVREVANGEHVIVLDVLADLMWSVLFNIQVGLLILGTWLVIYIGR